MVSWLGGAVVRGAMSEDVAYIAWKHRNARQDNDIMFLCRCFCIQSVGNNIGWDPEQRIQLEILFTTVRIDPNRASNKQIQPEKL
jgi:hypothetical protein